MINYIDFDLDQNEDNEKEKEEDYQDYADNLQFNTHQKVRYKGRRNNMKIIDSFSYEERF